jgi:hypothetical protein
MHAKTIGHDMVKKNNYPGTGTYELMNMQNFNLKKAPGYKIGSETRERDTHAKEQKNKPGAGTYSQDQFAVMRRSAPNFSFGKS